MAQGMEGCREGAYPGESGYVWLSIGGMGEKRIMAARTAVRGDTLCWTVWVCLKGSNLKDDARPRGAELVKKASDVFQ